MITNKDIRVENGNLVLTGDKYPLDGQSPEAIMQIVKDNSDSTPTAESTNPVTSAGIKTYVDTKISDLIKTQYVDTSVASMSPGITTVTLPLTIPSGYSCVGVIQALTSSTLVSVAGAFIDTANGAAKINCSKSQTASNVTVAATVLYIKS